MSHIKGKFNVISDQLSRNTTISTEWALHPKDFQRLILRENRNLQVDLFATSLNHQLKTFVSPCPDKETKLVDAMAINWEQWKHLYLYPPRCQISKALSKLLQTKFETAVLITPETRTQPWYMALRLRKIPSKLIQVRLQQIVDTTLVKAPEKTDLRVWKLSKQHIIGDSRTAVKQ